MFLTSREQKLIQTFLKRGKLTIAEMMEITDTSRRTLYRDLNNLQKSLPENISLENTDEGYFLKGDINQLTQAHELIDYSISERLYGELLLLIENKASIASSHLWDWETSEYNVDFVKKLLPGIPCTIINLTYRIQGFYVQKGNPKNINGWKDLKRDDLSYVNREIGCGVRVLLDGKLRELNISSNEINGYNYEENSHLAVASAIARGKGDFGIGIEKVAKQIDNIDFIPLQKERYDLVIKTNDLENPIYKQILNI